MRKMKNKCTTFWGMGRFLHPSFKNKMMRFGRLQENDHLIIIIVMASSIITDEEISHERAVD